jgi:hypothetical protein
MQNARMKCLTGFASCCLTFLTMTSPAAPAPASRHIDLDVAKAAKPLDRFFDLSVGSDYPGTLIRDDCQAQLKTAVDELGFRYIRFHAIFHDVLGTVRVENGKNVYHWTKIDHPSTALTGCGVRRDRSAWRSSDPNLTPSYARRASGFHACLGSHTALSPASACDGATAGVGFRHADRRRHSGSDSSTAQYPACTPLNASVGRRGTCAAPPADS